jgi:hypothetical protein
VHGEIHNGCMAWLYKESACGVRRKSEEEKLKDFGRAVKRRVEDLRYQAVRVESEHVLGKM